MLKKVSALILAAMLAASLTACGGSNPNTNPTANTGSSSAVQSSVAAEASNTSIEGTTFTERDMQQEADTADAKPWKTDSESPGAPAEKQSAGSSLSASKLW